MINITLSSLRNNTTFFNIDDIATIINGRKKEEVGYFVPKTLKKEFKSFVEKMEQKKRTDKLKRIAKAAKADNIGDGAIDDGLH